MEDAHIAINFSYVRAHGILDDDVGSVNGINDYSFINIDKIHSYLLSIGMKPVIELDLVPSNFLKDPAAQISSDIFDCTERTNPITCAYPAYKGPPDNVTQWYDLVYQFVSHLVDRYGSDEVSTWIVCTYIL